MVDNYNLIAKFIGFERGFLVFEEIDNQKLVPIAKNHILKIGLNNEPKTEKQNSRRN